MTSGLYRRPLLATDLSPDAEEAARFAPFIVASDARGAGVTVLPELDLPPRVPREIRDELLDAVERRGRDAEAQVERWLRSHGLDGWTSSAPTGRIATQIVGEAKARQADVVLVGSRGQGRVEKGLLGSTSRAVLHRSQVDVLVARPTRHDGALRRVLVATDLHAPSVAASARALAIAKKNEAGLSVLHVIDRGDWLGALAAPEGHDAAALEKHLADELDAFDRAHLEGRATQMLATGRAARTIVAKADEIDADLLVIGTFGGGALSRALIGSVADAVAERASCSVLVVRPS